MVVVVVVVVERVLSWWFYFFFLFFLWWLGGFGFGDTSNQNENFKLRWPLCGLFLFVFGEGLAYYLFERGAVI